MEQRILSTIIQFTSCTFLLFAALLWVRRNKNRSRIYFSIASFVCGIDLFLRIFHVYNGTPQTFKALQPGYLYLALIEIPLFLLYLVEVKKSSLSNRRVCFYASLIFCIGVFHGLFLLTSFAVISILHLLFCVVFCLLVTYQELFARIQVPATSETESISTTAREPVIDISPTDGNIHLLWIELNQLMNEEKLWRNPDITQEYLASLLGIGHPALSMVIKDNGFAGYKEYLNHYRIEDFLKIINRDNTIGIQEAFFNVGYRSQEKALQYFQEHMGCTPTEYLNRIAENE